MPKSVKHLLVSILLAQTAGLVGSVFTTGSINNWYQFLQKPSFAPPNWLFAPAWLTLYTLMGGAAYLVWQGKKKKEERRAALTLYAVHLVANALWSIIFFGFKNIGLAFAEILILWTLIFAVIGKFSHLHRTAGLLLVPYLVWVTFAAALNLSLWLLNS